jgi:hypothetical protein
VGAARLEARLAELVSSLERDSLPGPETLEASFARVAGALEELRASGAPSDGPLTACRCLHALALALCARRLDELGAKRQTFAQLRTRLDQARAQVKSGASCDMAA